MYDVTSADSFNSVPSWIKELEDKAPKNIEIAVVGNKKDLSEKE